MSKEFSLKNSDFSCDKLFLSSLKIADFPLSIFSFLSSKGIGDIESFWIFPTSS